MGSTCLKNFAWWAEIVLRDLIVLIMQFAMYVSRRGGGGLRGEGKEVERGGKSKKDKTSPMGPRLTFNHCYLF